jgi:hypothetical protein
MRRIALAGDGDELPLSSVRPHALFPGRATLYVREVARALGCTERHVIDLIEEYEQTGGKGGLKGFSIANGLAGAAGNKTSRSCWRVAVSDFDAFLKSKATSHHQ